VEVLYATDGSDDARRAEAFIRAIGNRASLDVTVLSVFAGGHHGREAPFFGRDGLVDLKARMEQAASEAAAGLRAAGFRVDALVADGAPGPRIVQRTARGHPDLTVVGAGRHRWVGRLLLGSTSFHVLHASPAPVLVVHETPSGPGPFRILVTADGSEGAASAAATVAAFADPRTCQMTVLVAHTPSHLPLPVPMAMAGTPLQQVVLAAPVGDADRIAADTARFLRRRGFRCSTVVTEGSPHSVISAECEARRYDLVVAGSRGRGPLGRAVLGSVSDAIARHAPAALIGRPWVPGPSR
jgi:nucleotide-binding universal stress UspA family protein